MLFGFVLREFRVCWFPGVPFLFQPQSGAQPGLAQDVVGIPQGFLQNFIGSLSKIETGKRNMTFEQCRRIALALETSMDYLAGLTDEQRPYPPKK